VTVNIDRTGGGVEAVEDQQPADRPPPPPPPDNPGAEPEGVPSRADSRAAAAAANRLDTSQPVEDQPEPPPEPESSEPNETADEATSPASPDTSSDSGERDAAVENERPPARDVEVEPLNGPGVTTALDGGREQQPGTLATSPAEDTPVDGELASAQAATPFEAAYCPTSTDQESARLDETAATPSAADSWLFGDPGNEPEGVPSRADSRAGAAANGELVEKPVDRRFAKDGTAASVIDFVGDLRSRSERLADAIDPKVAERLIWHVLGEGSIADLDTETKASHQFLLLGGLVADAHLDAAGLDEFLATARELGDRLIGDGAGTDP
jgi:hypothetical protein